MRRIQSLHLEGKLMKSYLSVLFAGVIAATFVTTAFVISPARAAEKGPAADPMDCAKWKDKGRCEALKKDILACRDKIDDEWHECMHLPPLKVKFTSPRPRDCNASHNKPVCESFNTALDACKDKGTRAEFRTCMSGQVQVQASKKN